jgi:hypothetical protein
MLAVNQSVTTLVLQENKLKQRHAARELVIYKFTFCFSMPIVKNSVCACVCVRVCVCVRAHGRVLLCKSLQWSRKELVGVTGPLGRLDLKHVIALWLTKPRLTISSCVSMCNNVECVCVCV